MKHKRRFNQEQHGAVAKGHGHKQYSSVHLVDQRHQYRGAHEEENGVHQEHVGNKPGIAVGEQERLGGIIAENGARETTKKYGKKRPPRAFKPRHAYVAVQPPHEGLPFNPLYFTDLEHRNTILPLSARPRQVLLSNRFY